MPKIIFMTTEENTIIDVTEHVTALTEKENNKAKVTIYQSNYITKARYDYTPLEKNIMYSVLAQINTDKTDNKYYRVSIKRLQKATDTKNSYSDYNEAVERLMKKIITIPISNGNILKTALLSSVEYIKNKGIIEIGIESKLKPFLFQLKKNFTTYQLDAALTLKSKYSKRLYEMLSQFKDTGTWIVSVLELKERFLLYDTITGKEKFIKWSALEKYILKVAQREINNNTDIRFSYTKIKEGRKYTKIQFNIKQQPYQIGIDFKNDSPEDAELSKKEKLYKSLTGKYCLRKDQAKKVLLNYTEKEIGKILYDIQIAYINNQIKNMGAYTAKVFDV